MGIETCFNCNKQIGRLEQAYIYNSKVVCQRCYEALNNTSSQGNSIPQDSNTKVVNVVTTEKTSKLWKAIMLIGGILILSGLGFIFGARVIWELTGRLDFNPRVIGLYMIIAGVPCYILARMLAWWNHG